MKYTLFIFLIFLFSCNAQVKDKKIIEQLSIKEITNITKDGKMPGFVKLVDVIDRKTRVFSKSDSIKYSNLTYIDFYKFYTKTQEEISLKYNKEWNEQYDDYIESKRNLLYEIIEYNRLYFKNRHSYNFELTLKFNSDIYFMILKNNNVSNEFIFDHFKKDEYFIDIALRYTDHINRAQYIDEQSKQHLTKNNGVRGEFLYNLGILEFKFY